MSPSVCLLSAWRVWSWLFVESCIPAAGLLSWSCCLINLEIVVYGFFLCPCFLVFTDWVPVACKFWRDAHSSTCNPTNQLTHSGAVTLFSAPSSISPTAAQNRPLASVFLLHLWSLLVFCYQSWLLTRSCYWVGVWPLLPQKKSTCVWASASFQTKHIPVSFPI